MKRRDFIRNTALMAGAVSIGQRAFAANREEPKPTVEQPKAEGQLIVSAPMLQNYAETSMGVAFAVSDLANGYVIYGQQPDLSDGKKVKCGGYRTTDISDRVIQVMLILPTKTRNIFPTLPCGNELVPSYGARYWRRPDVNSSSRLISTSIATMRLPRIVAGHRLWAVVQRWDIRVVVRIVVNNQRDSPPLLRDG